MKFKSVLFVLILIGLCTPTLFAQNAGEIVFSKSMIDPANPTNLTTEFQAGDPIYAMAYFDKTILELVNKSTAKNVDMEIFVYELKPPLYDYQQPSEMQLETASVKISGALLNQKHLPVDIIPAPEGMTAYGSSDLVYKKFGPSFAGPVKFAEKMSQLEAGEHTIIVKVNCNYAFVAEGQFVIKGDDYSGYQAQSAALNDAADNIKTKEAIMPKAAHTDKQLEQDMIKAFTASQTYKDRVKGDVLRVVIIDPDWMIRRNELTGVILHRYIRAAIAVKNGDGTCTVWQNVTFQQDYVSDAFQATRFDGIGDSYQIPCDSVNK